MRNTFTIVASATLLVTAYALDVHDHRSAATWAGHRVGERLMYAQGYQDGLKKGELDGSLLAGNAERIDKDDYLKRLQKGLREQLGTGKSGPLGTSEIEKAMTEFYSDPLNASVCWSNAFRFAAMSLNRDPPIEEELRLARESGAKSGCL